MEDEGVIVFTLFTILNYFYFCFREESEVINTCLQVSQ